MPIQYYFDNLEPSSFQRLVNVLLTLRYGEGIRLLPLRGADGGRDAETAAPTSYFTVKIDKSPSLPPRLKPGRYLFQVKHHRTTDRPGTAVRSAVVADFANELTSNVLNRDISDPVNYFFLITNVPGSKDAVSQVDEKRRDLLVDRDELHGDVLWQEHVISWLDQSPTVWTTFPEIFAGMIVPSLGQVANTSSKGIPRSVRLAIAAQSKRDEVIRFRQINLEQRLSKLFVDLDVTGQSLTRATVETILGGEPVRMGVAEGTEHGYYYRGLTSMSTLLSEANGTRKIILEGGPGQGKSTVTQTLAQLYRAAILNSQDEYKRIWNGVPKARFPFRVELRLFAEWMNTGNRSVDQFLAETFSIDAGGGEIKVEDIHTIVEKQPVLLIFDGLDEVGSDDLRDAVIAKISECVERFETQLGADIRVIVASRPPAIAGRTGKLSGFTRIQILSLSKQKVQDYVLRWTETQCTDLFERTRVTDSFNKRKSEQHVSALVKNPMQLSVLLHFIRLKGEAFPDRRAELYREYFKTVIDRDVEKSPKLRQNRDEIEALHEVIAFEIHSRAESDAAATSLNRRQLLAVVESWLAAQGRKVDLAQDLFRIGEERLGLIVALRGEGADARYGFEVQPVREYFTAAFINDKFERNAHELFQNMVPRPFWREVALFLAGLRRANEKADLLSRARALDSEIGEGWRGHGRAIVLQLLQEGVLTNPGHVHRDAIAFLLEGLNPSRHSTNEPRELIHLLPELIKACDNPQPREMLDKLLAATQHNEDWYVLWRIWTVANRILPSSTLEGHVQRYSGNRTLLEARVKLLWPSQARLAYPKTIDTLLGKQSKPDTHWAESWFAAVFSEHSLTGLKSTPQYHEHLVEQFAFRPLQRSFLAELLPPLRPVKPYAVWRLYENIQLLTSWFLAPEKPLSAPGGVVDYSGLSEATGHCVAGLIESSSTAIESLTRGKGLSKSLSKFFESVDQLIGVDGLPAWVACRCAVTMMQCTEAPHHMLVDGHTYYANPGRPRLAHIDAWVQLRRNLTPLFRAYLAVDLDKAGRTFARRILDAGLHRGVPSHIRVRGKLESVPGMLVQNFRSGHLEMDWLNRVPIPKYWVPEMLTLDPSMSVFPLFARRRLNWFGPSPSLDLVQMKKIQAAVTQSTDPEFLAGALFVLFGSSFWNIFGTRTLTKMLESDALFQDVAERMFDATRTGTGWIPPRMTELAELIVGGSVSVSQATATAAARFLAENVSVKRPPLRTVGSFPVDLCAPESKITEPAEQLRIPEH